MALSEGELFAGYTIRGRLGAGGMGEVYLVAHPRLPRPEALKVLPRSTSADPEFRKRFDREAELAATMFHPNIVGVHDRGEFNGQLWISMDYIAGTDASRLVKGRYPGGMPTPLALDVIGAVAGALDYAHQRGLLHRDVKPANVLLSDPETPSQRIFLADFGIARHIADGTSLTPASAMIGTMSYSSPEQLSGDRLDGRSDQYGLACTAYYILTGAPPFVGPQPAATVSQHLYVPPPSISARRTDLAAMDPVFAKALAKDPRARFANCTEFAEALRRAAAAPPAPARTVVAPRPFTGPPPQGPPPHQGPPRQGPPYQGPPTGPPPYGPPGFGPPPGPPGPAGRSRRTLIAVGAAAAVVVLTAGIVTVAVTSSDDSDSATSTTSMVRSSTSKSSKSSTPRSTTPRSSTQRATTPPARPKPPVTFTVAGVPRDIGTDVSCASTGSDVTVVIGDPLTNGVSVVVAQGVNPPVRSVALGLVDGVRLSYDANDGRGKAFAATDEAAKVYGIVGDAFGVDPVNPSQTVQKYFELGFSCP